jgi:hypothetical protein
MLEADTEAGRRDHLAGLTSAELADVAEFAVGVLQGLYVLAAGRSGLRAAVGQLRVCGMDNIASGRTGCTHVHG